VPEKVTAWKGLVMKKASPVRETFKWLKTSTSTHPNLYLNLPNNIPRGDTGRTRSAIVSNAFKNINIPVALGISSEFCRATQTLELLELDFPMQTDGRLNHDTYNTSPEPAYDNLEDIILENPQENGVLIVVGHSNLKDNNPYLDYIHPFSMYDGFLMKREGDQLRFIGYLPFEYWRLF
jgi:hypothetical protein